jgi:hypothetical protein
MSWIWRDSAVRSSVSIVRYVGKLKIKEWVTESVRTLGSHLKDERVKVVH